MRRCSSRSPTLAPCWPPGRTTTTPSGRTARSATCARSLCHAQHLRHATARSTRAIAHCRCTIEPTRLKCGLLPESWTGLSGSFPAMVEPGGGAVADEEVEVHGSADCLCPASGGGRHLG